MVKNALIGVLCMILLVTAGSFAYVGYHNTKAHIRAENEKHKAEELQEEPKPDKKELAKKKAKQKAMEEKKTGNGEVDEEINKRHGDIAYLVENMYVTPSANGDVAYRYEEEKTAGGIFMAPYVIEHKGAPAALHIVAGCRGDGQVSFDRIAVKGDNGDHVLAFPREALQQKQENGYVLSCYDLPASPEMESVMRSISSSVNVKISIVGQEQENKFLSQAEIGRFKDMLELYDEMRDAS